MSGSYRQVEINAAQDGGTRFMGIRKGKSTIMIFDRLANGGTGMGIGTFREEDIL